MGKAPPIRPARLTARRDAEKNGRTASGKAGPPNRGRVTVQTTSPDPKASDRHYIHQPDAVLPLRQARFPPAKILGQFPPNLTPHLQRTADHASKTSGNEARATATSITSSAS